MFIGAPGTSSSGSNEIISFMPDLVSHSETDYGYAFERSLKQGPIFYAMGMSSGLGFSPADEAEKAEITNWRKLGFGEKSYREGCFRDVFLNNVLARVHLKNRVLGVPFDKWIGSKNLGTLTKVGRSNWLWSIGESKRIQARDALAKAGLITSQGSQIK